MADGFVVGQGKQIVGNASLIFLQDTLTAGLNNMSRELNDAVQAVMELYAPRVEAYMKNTAPWTDQTGLARAGLGARAVDAGSGNHAIVLYHTVAYGIWLEVRWSGTYAVIRPTIDVMGPQVMSALNDLMGKMR